MTLWIHVFRFRHGRDGVELKFTPSLWGTPPPTSQGLGLHGGCLDPQWSPGCMSISGGMRARGTRNNFFFSPCKEVFHGRVNSFGEINSIYYINGSRMTNGMTWNENISLAYARVRTTRWASNFERLC